MTFITSNWAELNMQIKQPQPAGDGYICGMFRYSSPGTDKLPSYYVLMKGHDEAYLYIFPCVLQSYTMDQGRCCRHLTPPVTGCPVITILLLAAACSSFAGSYVDMQLDILVWVLFSFIGSHYMFVFCYLRDCMVISR